MKRCIVYKSIFIIVLVLFVLSGCQADNEVEETTSLLLATTTSTYDSGLLHELLPDFEREHNIEVEIIAVGTGQAVEIGKRGDCDIILVHARDLEDKFVAEGYGTERWDVMYNDFVIVGPAGDPGEITDSTDVAEAFDNMVSHMEEGGVNFLSRGDNSGTHNKEINLWEIVDMEDYNAREWYNSLGQGMGDTLIAANEMQGYALTDRGTYLSMEDKLPNLELVFEGDEDLFNPYGIIPANPEEHPGVKHEKAMLLVEFFISDEIQERIVEFGKEEYGQPLFFPNAD